MLLVQVGRPDMIVGPKLEHAHCEPTPLRWLRHCPAIYASGAQPVDSQTASQYTLATLNSTTAVRPRGIARVSPGPQPNSSRCSLTRRPPDRVVLRFRRCLPPPVGRTAVGRRASSAATSGPAPARGAMPTRAQPAASSLGHG